MNTVMIIAILFLSLTASLYLGMLLSVKFPLLDKWFDRKPFNCRPCLTFHLTVVITSLFAAVLKSAGLLVAGFAAAFILFLIVRYIDNKKVIK